MKTRHLPLLLALPLMGLPEPASAESLWLAARTRLLEGDLSNGTTDPLVWRSTNWPAGFEPMQLFASGDQKILYALGERGRTRTFVAYDISQRPIQLIHDQPTLPSSEADYGMDASGDFVEGRYVGSGLSGWRRVTRRPGLPANYLLSGYYRAFGFPRDGTSALGQRVDSGGIDIVRRDPVSGGFESMVATLPRSSLLIVSPDSRTLFSEDLWSVARVDVDTGAVVSRSISPVGSADRIKNINVTSDGGKFLVNMRDRLLVLNPSTLATTQTIMPATPGFRFDAVVDHPFPSRQELFLSDGIRVEVFESPTSRRFVWTGTENIMDIATTGARFPVTNRNSTWPSRIVARTMQFADLDGDGVDDLCSASSGGVWCATTDPRTGDIHGATRWSWSFSYPEGRVAHPDLDGDGRHDICEQRTSGIYCALSTGQSFVGQSWWLSLSLSADAVVRYADIDADQDDDVCIRRVDGIYCARSDGTRFTGFTRWLSNFRDDQGWAPVDKSSTIDLADIDGDGDADICGRGNSGMVCAKSTRTAFAAATFWSPGQFTDGSGWNQPNHYETLQFADVDGDGASDVCGRGDAGMICRISTGSSFGGSDIVASDFGNGAGWTAPEHYRTIFVVDVNGDGAADVCGRGNDGLICSYAVDLPNPRFAPSVVRVANFGDNFGWDGSQDFWGSIRPAQLDGKTGVEFCGRGSSQLLCSIE